MLWSTLSIRQSKSGLPIGIDGFIGPWDWFMIYISKRTLTRMQNGLQIWVVTSRKATKAAPPNGHRHADEWRVANSEPSEAVCTYHSLMQGWRYFLVESCGHIYRRLLMPVLSICSQIDPYIPMTHSRRVLQFSSSPGLLPPYWSSDTPDHQTSDPNARFLSAEIWLLVNPYPFLACGTISYAISSFVFLI